MFSLPGAYTPTCSSTHLPRYNELAPRVSRNGVDDIVCISVNDAFVMNEWKQDQEAENITVVPDGNGDFTRGMGMLVDKRDLGFGKRSWRYSMLVRDGVIEKMFIEPEREGDPFEVSDADTMLRHLNPEARAPEPIVMFSKPGCPHCARAKAALTERGLRYTEISQDQKINTSVLRAVSGRMTWPQVFIGGRLIGSADDLQAYLGTWPRRPREGRGRTRKQGRDDGSRADALAAGGRWACWPGRCRAGACAGRWRVRWRGMSWRYSNAMSTQYRAMDPAARARLERLVRRFLHEKTFVGCAGLEITDEMRLTIAGQACLLLMGARGDAVYPTLNAVLVYPGAFLAPRRQVDAAGVVTEERQDLLGESWGDGRVILSWDHVRRARHGRAAGPQRGAARVRPPARQRVRRHQRRPLPGQPRSLPQLVGGAVARLRRLARRRLVRPGRGARPLRRDGPRRILRGRHRSLFRAAAPARQPPRGPVRGIPEVLPDRPARLAGGARGTSYSAGVYGQWQVKALR